MGTAAILLSSFVVMVLNHFPSPFEKEEDSADMQIRVEKKKPKYPVEKQFKRYFYALVSVGKQFRSREHFVYYLLNPCSYADSEK